MWSGSGSREIEMSEEKIELVLKARNQLEHAITLLQAQKSRLVEYQI